MCSRRNGWNVLMFPEMDNYPELSSLAAGLRLFAFSLHVNGFSSTLPWPEDKGLTGRTLPGAGSAATGPNQIDRNKLT